MFAVEVVLAPKVESTVPPVEFNWKLLKPPLAAAPPRSKLNRFRLCDPPPVALTCCNTTV